MSAMPGTPPQSDLARAPKTSRPGADREVSVAGARVPVPGPGRQHEQQPRVRAGAHLVALVRIEHGQQARAAGDRAVAAGDLDLAVDDDDVGPLVDLVLL